MKSSNRRISIVVATHERPELLRRTLTNVTRQTLQPLEMVIVDDGSGPATRDAVFHWKESTRPRFHVHYQWQQNQGPATARNRGLEASRGDWVQFLDDDDLMAPDALEQLAAVLEVGQTGIAMASYQYWQNGNPTGTCVAPKNLDADGRLRAMIQGTWFVPIHGYLFTRSALEQIGPWNPVLTSQEDDEFLLRAAMARVPMHPAPKAKVYYCQHTGPRRATPGKPGETEAQGLERRMYADLAIRELAFESLSQKEDIENYRISFGLWQMRLRKRYLPYLHKLNPPSELLQWLAAPVEEDSDASDLPPPVASV